MLDPIGHPEVRIGMQEWPHQERGRLAPRFRGGGVGIRLLLYLSALVNHAGVFPLAGPPSSSAQQLSRYLRLDMLPPEVKNLEELSVAVKKLREGARLPEYASAGAAGLDLYTCLDEPMQLPPGNIARIPTGIAVAIPRGHVGLIRDRSSLAMAGIHTVAGVIDSDYRGEIMIAVHNAGPASIDVRSGERIAQMVILPCPRVRVSEARELPTTERGTGGFGSTGR